jgi:hypothetical protein
MWQANDLSGAIVAAREVLVCIFWARLSVVEETGLVERDIYA